MNQNELLTLSQLAKKHGITEDCARKRASRGWYEKIKVGTRTYYREIVSEHRPETVEYEPEAYDTPEPPRPEKEPFPGAWEIVDSVGVDYPWTTIESVGMNLDGDGEAVCRWVENMKMFDLAFDTMEEHIRDGEGILADLGRMSKQSAVNAILDDLRECFVYANLSYVQSWIDLEKPRVAPKAVLEQHAANGDKEAKEAIERTPEEYEKYFEAYQERQKKRYED